MTGSAETAFARYAGEIERRYGLRPTAISPAPRGFAAETYFVDTSDGSFFLKIMHTPRRQHWFLHGLQVVDALAKRGIDFIPRVLQTLSGELHFALGGAVAALFTRLDARHTYQYDREDIFRKLARIYRVSAGFPDRDRFRRETFSEHFIDAYESELAAFRESRPEGEEARELRQLLEPHLAFLTACPDAARRLAAACRAHRAEFYLTHSDYTNNVLVSDDGRQYLIDFDEAIFGPPERDGFLSLTANAEERELWLSVMREALPGYRVNEDFVRYYLLERFMVDLTTFMREAAHHPDPGHRRKVVDATRDYLLGWLYPRLSRMSG